MPSKGDNLLRHARVAKGGWRQHELERLYLAFGFETEDGKKHIKFWHPKYPHLFATVTKSSGELPTGYVAKAVRLIDAAAALNAQEAHDDGE